MLTGGKRDGAVYYPTVLTNVHARHESGGGGSLCPGGIGHRLRRFRRGAAPGRSTANFGLQVGVFTRDIDRVFQAVQALNFGGVIINDTPAFRADHMPYGGNRQSGLGREGVRFAMEEMTNIQMVAIR